MATLEKLEAEFHRFKKRSTIWQILFGLAVVIAIVLLFTVFRKKESPNEELLKSHQQTIEALQRSNALIDSLFKSKDKEYQANRPTETRIITRYEKIPSTVRDLSKEQLRREFTEFE